ncbi:FAD-binding protein [Nocardia sp. NPDC004068]|uniref:FAD-dependent oxidoreductase n=1 Tax=Nocardia sp. NPDC004068 TaxID=3364303 RepID=UPI00368ACD2C
MTTATLDALTTALFGRVTTPDDPTWDEARTAWQLLADQHPFAVVTATNRHDVELTVRTAAALGLRVAPQSTGHNAGPLGDLSRSILLRTNAIDHIDIDPPERRARVGAGVRWGDLTAAAATAGLAPIGGCAPGVGVVGLVLGGGLGWFARSHGPAAASVLELELVTPEGVSRTVRAGEELFDMVLSGADIAVVTAVTLRLHVFDDLFAGALFWPATSAREVFRAWNAWTATTPETVTSVARVLRFPETPDVPPQFAGRAFTVIEAVIQASAAEANTLLTPLRELSPHTDTFAPATPPALAALHMDPPTPVPALGHSALLRDLPAEVLDALAAAVTTGPATTLTSLELRQLGGALDRFAGPTSGSKALLFAVAVTPHPVARPAATIAFDALTTAVAPAHSNRASASFTETPTDPAPLFGPDLNRLRSAKRQWDPTNLIHANHSVLEANRTESSNGRTTPA